jgi:hypothetical protein
VTADFHERAEELRSKHEFMRLPLVRDIERRVEECGFRYGWSMWKDGSGEPWLRINIYGGHEIRVDRTTLDAVAAAPFESWRGIYGYHGYVDLGTNTLNCRVNAYLGDAQLDRLGFVPVGGPLAEAVAGTSQPRRLSVEGPRAGFRITLESASLNPGILVLSELRERGLVIVIEPADVADAVTARSKLVQLAGAAFFELDRRSDIRMHLARKTGGRLARGRRSEAQESSFRYPSKVYDENAVTIYQHARELASNRLVPMRSACYLAYYQVLEYFMPAFGRAEAMFRVRNHLLDPGFDANDDTRVGRLLNEVIASKRFESERTQLRATLRACVTDQEMVAYFDSRESDAALLAGPGHISSVRRISRSDSTPLIDQCADRVYDIRCRIVHSKDATASGQSAAILPGSAEEVELDADVELIEYLARAVIAASGRDVDPSP